MSSIGNSGARSSGPTGWSVPGCSGGGGGAGRSGITLYHGRGISDSSSVILVRSGTTNLRHGFGTLFRSEPYALTAPPAHNPPPPPPTPRPPSRGPQPMGCVGPGPREMGSVPPTPQPGARRDSAHEGLDGGGQFGHR